MAESMVGLKRSHRCTEVTSAQIGEKVTVMGWVQKSRNKGGIIFVDLRDRSGILQIIFEENDCGTENFEKAEKLRSEFVIAVEGRVEARSGAVNENLATGAIEVRAESLRILAESETPPFPIEEKSKTKEDLRLEYRFLDLRRPDIQRNLMLRSRVATLTRAFLAEEGFLEIETPTLIKSTPEGARDYLVPSRVHPGSFYALPQSPQLFKQLLMVSGYDRYFQLARCYRDEDLRADRQPEFTQIDMELSFVDVDDVLDVNERLLKKLFKEVCNYDLQLPIQRMTWREAMDRFGSDKPDLRFGMELKNVSEVVKDCEFVVFKSALENGGSVRGINAEGQGHMPRKKIDALVEYAKGFGAKGLAYIAINEDGTYKSSFAKFMKDEEMAALDEIDPKQTAVVDQRFAAQVDGFTPQADSTATIQLQSYRPNKLVYQSKSATDQLAVFSEIYYQPGWKATVDGKPVEHLRADWILRAMRVPAGEHEIVFEFKPEGYIIAANVEAYSSFLILVLLIVAVGYSVYTSYKKTKEE